MASFVKVGAISDLAPGQAKKVEISGKTIALFNRGGTYYAIDDACPHRGGPLSEGQVEADVVTCPWHGSKFDIRTGGLLGPPAQTGVTSYRVRVTGTDIEVEM